MKRNPQTNVLLLNNGEHMHGRYKVLYCYSATNLNACIVGACMLFIITKCRDASVPAIKCDSRTSETFLSLVELGTILTDLRQHLPRMNEHSCILLYYYDQLIAIPYC